MCLGKVYLQSMIMVSVSLSLASWNGAAPHTSMYRITPSDQMSGKNCSMIGIADFLNLNFYNFVTRIIFICTAT